MAMVFFKSFGDEKMIIKRIKQIACVGLFIGLFMAIDEGLVAIVLEPMDVFGYLSYLSLVAMSFLVVISSLVVMGVLLAGWGFLSLIKIGRRWGDEHWIGFFVGLGVVVRLFIYLGTNIVWVVNVSQLFLWVLILGVEIVGGVAGLMVYVVLSNRLRNKKLGKFFKAGGWLAVKGGFVLWVVFLGVLLAAGVDRSVKGRPGLAFEVEREGVEQKTNVVLITIDALRADVMGKELTPEIYNFSKSGVGFTHAYAPSSWTPSSFAAIHSGLDPGATGTSVSNFEVTEVFESAHLDDEVYSLAEEFSDKGYMTQAIVTNSFLREERNFGQGFDGYLNLGQIKPYHWKYVAGKVRIFGIFGRLPRIGGWVEEVYNFLVGETGVGWLKTRAEMVSDVTLEWLGGISRDQPFLLWVHYIDAHEPYDPVEEFSPSLEGFSEDEERTLRKLGLRYDELRWRDMDKQVLRLLYEGDVRYTDRQVGRVLGYLEKEGLLENTIVVIASDHGEAFLEHGKLGHGNNFYEEEVRIPLIIKAPQLSEREGEVVDRKVSIADLGPTLWELLEGEGNLKRNMLSEEYGKIIFLEANGYGPELKAAVWEDWKYIWNISQNSYELYNLKSDPQEKVNLVGNFPVVERELKAFLEERTENNKKIFEELKKTKGFDSSQDFGEIVGY